MSTLTRNYRPTDRLHAISARKIVSKEIPPGGGACHWCARKLYRDKKGFHYAVIFEGGHERAVHLQDCANQTLGRRPEQPLRFDNA